MLKMRLQRVGRKHSPSYRVLIVDSRQGPKSGKYIDQIGSYDPRNDQVALDGEKARSWIAKGVKTSGTVHNLLVSQKIIEGKKINVLPRKSPIKKEGGETVASAASASEQSSEPAPESVSESAPEAPTGDAPDEAPATETTEQAEAVDTAGEAT